jgi:hypothetical protein
MSSGTYCCINWLTVIDVFDIFQVVHKDYSEGRERKLLRNRVTICLSTNVKGKGVLTYIMKEYGGVEVYFH